MGKTAVLEPYAHHKGGFSRPMCDLGQSSQPAGGGITLTL